MRLATLRLSIPLNFPKSHRINNLVTSRTPSQVCPLCQATDAVPIHADLSREYWQCIVCSLIFVPARFFIPHDKELARYNLHKNSADQSAYCRYLNTFAEELNRIPLLRPSVLDFGSGPNAVLTELLNKRGHVCTAYDPLYKIGNDAFKQTYDVVLICEVIEHLHSLNDELLRIKSVLNPGGYIIVRTALFKGAVAEFGTWFYKNDSTHIRFFSDKAFGALAKQFLWQIVYCNNPVVILHDAR